MERERFILTISLQFILGAVSATGSRVPAVYVFGDSIFDAGNNHFNRNTTIQADFPPYGSTFFHHPTGRFTNGRTVADFVAEYLNMPLQKPYMEVYLEMMSGRGQFPANGINFASAGSGVLRATNNDTGVTPIQIQLQQFQTLVKKSLINKKLIEQSFFFLESGSNDVVNYFNPFYPQTLTPEAYIQSMLNEARNFVDEICNLGARRVAVFGLGPVGCVPARALLPGAPVTKCFGKMNKMVKSYNMGLENLAEGLHVSHPGAVGVFGDVYKTIQIFRANPSRYGFADVERACCGYGRLGGELQCGKEGYTLCKNPNQYLFWDFFHPSQRTYKLVSKALWGGGPKRIRPFNLRALSNITLV